MRQALCRLLIAAALIGAGWRVVQGQWAWPPPNGSVLPSTCVAGRVYWFTDATSTELYRCTATDTWTLVNPAAGGAPTDATYLAQTAHGSLSAEQALSVLATGVLKVTTGTGVLSTAVAGTDYAGVTHTHAIGDTTNLQTTLDGKAASSHGHAIADITALQTTLDGKALSSHSHPEGDLSFSDIATANATTAAHGLLPKLSGSASDVLRGDGTFGAGGSGAPTDARYWVGAAHAGLSAEENLGALSTGLVINTAGTPSAYAGATCTNQFPRSLSASGAPTCADVAPADFTSQTANLVLAAPDGASGDPTFRALVDADVPNTITLTNLTQVTTRAISDTTGTLAVGRGGTGLTATADDAVFVGDSASALTARTLPSCSNGTTDKLLYNISTNTFSCGADQGGSGASLTRIAGSSGAAGADFTWQNLTANCAANATTTLATCMATTGVGAGTWSFKYKVLYQAAAATTGVDFAVNHTGTVTQFTASSWLVTTGGAAANGIGDQIASNTASLAEGKAARATNTKFGSTLGVDTINANLLYVIEGLIVVTVSGNLELKHASEVAASTQVMADTTLELHKIE